MFTIEKFILFWNSVHSNKTLVELFKRYLIQKPYDKDIGQKLIFQLGQVQTESKELQDFLAFLCKVIGKNSMDLKTFITTETKDTETKQPEVTFIEILENNLYPVPEVSAPNFSFMYTTRSQPILSANETILAQAGLPDSEISDADENILHKAETLTIAASHLKLGIKYEFTDKNYVLAEQNYRKAVELYGAEDSFETFEATLGLELTLLKLEKLDEALLYHTKVSERLSRLSPKELTHDRWKKLLTDFNYNLKAIANAYLKLGNKYEFTDKNYVLSEQNYRKAVELYGTKDTFGTFEATLGLELTLLKLEKLDEASLYHTIVSERLSRLSPKELTHDRWKKLLTDFNYNLEAIAKAYLKLGNKYEFTDNYVLAEQNYRKAVELYGTKAHFWDF